MKPHQSQKEQVRDLLASSGQRVDAVLRQKDTSVGGDVARDLRGHDRLQYQVRAGLRCTFRHPGGGEDTFLVQSYNLSKSGIGLIHGSFVYTGTPCSIELFMPDGKLKWVAGVVTRCNHITGKIHDLGIRFDEEMKQGWYDGAGPAGDVDTAAKNDLAAFSGSVLLFTASKNDRDLARYALAKLQIEVTAVSKMDEAVQLAGTSKHNLVMATVWDEDDGQGLELARTLRDMKYPFPVIGLIGAGMEDVRRRATESGCTDFIESLTDYGQLSKVMSTYLPSAASSKGQGEPLVSSKWSDVPFRPMIGQYLDHLEKMQLPGMRRALAGDLKELRCICRDLRVTGAAYGFETIAEMATQLQALCAEGTDAQEREKVHSNLASMIMRAISSASNDQATTGTA